MLTIGEKYIKLDTPNSSLIFCRYDELLETIYYGAKVRNAENYDILTGHKRKYVHAYSDDSITANMTVSAYGMGCDRSYSAEIANYDGGIANKFLFKEARKAEKPHIDGMPSSYGAAETLELVYADEDYKIQLRQYYSVFEDSDAIAVSCRLVNLSDKSFTIKSLKSLQCDLDGCGYEIYSYTGAWGRERNQQVTRLRHGMFTQETKCGMSSHKVNPFLMLKAPERMGGYYAFNLVYSGNHKETVESAPMNITRVLVGINDFGGERQVCGGGYFHTPEAVMAYGRDQSAVAQAMHGYVNEHLIPREFRCPRPVVVNLWGPMQYNFDAKKAMEYVELAAKLGIETVIVDDGWFGKRCDETSSLGDWTDFEEKTGGLDKFSAEVHRRGLKFGIWMEPEMISPNSELFRAHPEYVLRNPLREPLLQRWQLVLDLTNPAVADYVAESVCRVVETFHADYLKWDCNRVITDAFSQTGGSEDYFYRYVKALYSVLARIRERHPGLLIEGCAAGGGRFDLGMLAYMPQIWTSDMVDPCERVRIQEGTLIAYPPSCVSAHLAQAVESSVGRKTRLNDRFAVALEGVFGYETDLTEFSEEELKEVARQIEFYKKYRELLQYGKYYTAESCFGGSESRVSLVVSEDKTKAIARVFKLCNAFNREQNKYRFSGLDENTLYRVTCYENEKTFEAYGDLLNSYGLDLGDLFFRDRSGEYSNEINCIILVIEKAERA